MGKTGKLNGSFDLMFALFKLDYDCEMSNKIQEWEKELFDVVRYGEMYNETLENSHNNKDNRFAAKLYSFYFSFVVFHQLDSTIKTLIVMFHH